MSFDRDLKQVSLIRHELANCLEEMAAILVEAEEEGENKSGKLSVDGEIARVETASNNLRDSKFKLLVLGDMKRGKSTFINALLGERLLPSDVNPCTALLTVLRYGNKKQVTIYFKDSNYTETVDLKTFKQKYTISPEEAKVLAAENKLAFPDISYAAIEYPLPLLKEGLEIIDSPGLNDLEARNNLTLQYIYSCHGVLFLFRAIQPCTLEERRYLRNYLQGDITTFFIINAWDEIKDSLVDREDIEELKLAEDRIRQVFQANLQLYLSSERYNQRVFEVSSLTALRQKLKDKEANLVGTGFPEFIYALNSFLSQEKATAEFKLGQRIVQTVFRKAENAIDRRIPLLDETIIELKEKVASLKPEFDRLQEIRDNFRQDIIKEKAIRSKAISESFAAYILNLEKNFESDFLESQPDLNFTDFLDKKKRNEFQLAFQQAFERYMNDRLAAWEFTAKQELSASFDHLNTSGEQYQIDYQKVVAAINKKLLGSRFFVDEYRHSYEKASPWADNFSDIFFDVPDNVNGAINSFNTFWQTVLASICITVGLRIIGLLFSTIALNIFGAILLGFGTVALQAEYVRRQFLELTKKEFSKYLPRIAEEQKPLVYSGIANCFETYEQQAMEIIDRDLESRHLELNNLVKQKENYEIDRDGEIQRLTNLKSQLQVKVAEIESIIN